jgi:D-inositol-3-phosphate glycosyltransferase
MHRVAVVEPVGGHGGMNYYDLSLCRSLKAAGLEPTLYTCDKTVVNGDEGFKIETPYRGIWGKTPAWLRGLRFLLGSAEALLGSRLGGGALAHFHFFFVGPLEIFNVLLARCLGFRVVITAHDVEAFTVGLSVKKFVGWAYGMAHMVIAHNEVSQKELIEHINLDHGKIRVIHHGNYLEYVSGQIDKKAARVFVGVKSDDFVILFFGHIKEVKGLDVLLRAIPKVVADVCDRVQLVIAGKVWKDDFSRYQKLIDDMGLRDVCVLHIRHIPDQELPNFYGAADVVVLPYKRIYQSGVLLMAMSFGKPVVVSNVPGMMEVVTDGVNGLVFESENDQDLARQLIVARNDASLLEELTQHGYELMTTQYSWAEIGRQTALCYQQILPS